MPAAAPARALLRGGRQHGQRPARPCPGVAAAPHREPPAGVPQGVGGARAHAAPSRIGPERDPR
eukprot:14992117-Alexandrium_andersonii.AAC.1